MAILLIHLRRILLLVTVVYLVGALVRKLLYGGTAVATLRSSGFLFAKRLHLQPWVYIYTFYLYALVQTGAGWNELNLFDNFFR
ncbi:AGAP004875-PA-like protein [Anopheles sinensis]|uniref:AGAP004875-PA-like protein n=1 Tax=Anopheles sinensis TaxID=74873 RepID=A0A084WJC0_ANOSI|nr:AGAP004875-PA-like protein [Anopheles sinensis]